MEKSLSYQDVYLCPKYSELRSRSEADISVEFLGRKFKAPWLPANMESVIDIKQAKWLSENDYFYIMHRFSDNAKFIKTANEENWKTISISVGVKEEDRRLLEWCDENDFRIDFVTIDIAHGHSILLKEMIAYIKKYMPIEIKVIAGNVATPEAIRDLTDWGADAVKIGIAGGAACSTKHQTGFHVPMFSCVKNCVAETMLRVAHQNFVKRKVLEDFPDYKADFPRLIPIIADGGVRENGDISKALVAGATMVMAGGLFAACIDAPGENIYGGVMSVNPKIPPPPIIAKKYHGSASAKQKGEHKHVEGFEIEIPCNGLTYESKYQELTESMKSAVSYAGGKDLSAFKEVAYITIK